MQRIVVVMVLVGMLGCTIKRDAAISAGVSMGAVFAGGMITAHTEDGDTARRGKLLMIAGGTVLVLSLVWLSILPSQRPKLSSVAAKRPVSSRDLRERAGAHDPNPGE